MKPLLAIRPEPGLARTIALATEQGLQISGAPLFVIRPLPWEPPPAEAFDALLIGSANALRQGGPALDAFRHLPVFAVGPETARAARAAGFAVEREGRGRLQAVLDTEERARRYLRLAGRAHVPLTLGAGSTMVICIVYESLALPMPEQLAATLRAGALVLLHSAEAARHFAAECDRLAIAREQVALAAMAPRVAEAAGTGWQEVQSAAEPSESALLALARDMCH